MSHNNYTYHLVPIAQKALRESKGFVGGNISDDGQWIVGDKGDNENCMMWIDLELADIPQYMQDMGIVNCCLTNEKAQELVNHPDYHAPIDVI